MGFMSGGVSARDLVLDGHSVSLWVGGSPPVKVWPTRETVQITLGNWFEAQDQLRAALTDRGLNYQTVTEIPFGIQLVGAGAVQRMFDGCASLTHVPDMDTSRVKSMIRMFSGCSSLTSVPPMDTSQVTSTNAMFQNCSALTHVSDMDTSNVTNTYGMFRNCSALTHVPDMDTSRVTNMGYMFQNCSALTDGNVRLIGHLPNVITTSMIAGSGLTRIPFYGTDGNPI